MSLALAHFAIGATLTTLCVTYLIPGVRARSLIVLGGVWAMLPDIWRITPRYQFEIRVFHASPWADIFWFHATLDRVDPMDSQVFAFGMLLVFLVITVIAERRNHRALSVIRDRFGHADEVRS